MKTYNHNNSCLLSGHHLILILLISLTFGLAACNKTETATGPREKMTIAYWTGPSAALVQIAFAKNYFTEEGLEATPQPHPFGKIALGAVLDGNADIATVADTPIVLAVTGGKPIYVLAVIQTANRNEAIIASRDRGIARPSDLKGKRIGVTSGTNSDFFAYSFLTANGIDLSQVKVIDLRPDEMLYALSKGKVDAVSTWNPNLQLIRKTLGSRVTIFYNEAVYTETFCLAAKQDFVKAHPEAIKKVLRALVRAESFVNKEQDESRRIVSESSKIDKALLDETWSAYSFKVALNQSLLVTLEDTTRWALMRKLAIGKGVPNYLDFIYLTGLQAVRPEAVSIIR